MQVVPRHELPRQLRAAGLEPRSREFPDAASVHRLTVRECEPLPYITGPHRKVLYPDGRIEGPFPVADRPNLSAFVATVFAALPVRSALATVTEGAFWLNNRAQSAYLWKVADAQRVARFLRARGLTDRFQGAFRVRREQFATTLPLLAAHTYAGGSDVQFAALDTPGCRLTVLACHHFDLHFTTPDASLLETIVCLAEQNRLAAESLALPDLPDWSELTELTS